jgi:ribonuclease PH
MQRVDNRKNGEIREIKITKDFMPASYGSLLFEMGNTRIIVTASVSEEVPQFMKNKEKETGWLTAEYNMLPGSASSRVNRNKGFGNARGTEIQRLIGRSLRACIDLDKLGARTVYIDCEIIQSDGGTRTACITAGFIALSLAVNKLIKEGKIQENPIKTQVAAISVGILNKEIINDLCYVEDSKAEVDCNIVMDSNMKLVEVQGTGEEDTFTREELNKMIDQAEISIKELFNLQKKYIG